MRLALASRLENAFSRRDTPKEMDTFRILTALSSHLMAGLEEPRALEASPAAFLAKYHFNNLTETAADGIGLFPLYLASMEHNTSMIQQIIDESARSDGIPGYAK